MEIVADFKVSGSDAGTVRIPILAPADVPSKPIDSDTKFSFAYTGKHDGGELLPVNDQTPYAALEHAVGVRGWQ